MVGESLDRDKKGRFTECHNPWLQGRKGLQSWHNISGLRPHKKGKFKHSKETKAWISFKKREMFTQGLIKPWNKGLKICLNTGRTHFKSNV